MTDPKTAAGEVAERLAAKNIPIKRTQALSLIAAGIGTNRHLLSKMSELPTITSVNAALLSSAASVIARHDLARRATIVDTTGDVLLGRPERDEDTIDAGSIPLDARSRDEGPFVLVMEQCGETGNEASLFWNSENGWGHLSTATVTKDARGALPTAGMTVREVSSMRWMNVEDAALRAAVDEALAEIDAEDPTPMRYPDIEGERPIDYDRIAAMLSVRGVFARPVGPLEIAVRDGAQRASLYVSSLSDDPETAGGQVREWVGDVESAFRGAEIPSEDRQRGLLMEGDAAISGIVNRLEPNDRLWAWLEVAGYPDMIDNGIDPEASGVTDVVRLRHGDIDLWITASELGDPEAFLGSAKAKPIIDALVEDSYFTRWESSRSTLPEKTTQEIVTDFLGRLRTAKTDEERRFAKERTLVEHLSCNDPEDEWYQTGHSVWTGIEAELCGAVDAAGIDGYDTDEWTSAAASAFERRIVDDDDSTPQGMISSFDKVEIMFWLVHPKASTDDLCTIAGPWPDAARVEITDEFQFALAKLGWTVTDWRNHVGSKEPSQLSGTRPPRGTGQGASDAVDGSLDPLVSLEDLKVVIDNGCTQYFGLVLYAWVPLNDVLDIDLDRHVAFGKASVALYNPYAGTFMETSARPGTVVVKDGVDGRFEGLLGESPKDFCGMMMDGFDTHLTDHEKDVAKKAARRVLNEQMPGHGLRIRFPGHAIHWNWVDGTRTGLVADVGMDDATGAYSLRTVTAVFDPKGVPTITIEERG